MRANSENCSEANVKDNASNSHTVGLWESDFKIGADFERLYIWKEKNTDSARGCRHGSVYNTKQNWRLQLESVCESVPTSPFLSLWQICACFMSIFVFRLCFKKFITTNHIQLWLGICLIGGKARIPAGESGSAASPLGHKYQTVHSAVLSASPPSRGMRLRALASWAEYTELFTDLPQTWTQQRSSLLSCPTPVFGEYYQ